MIVNNLKMFCITLKNTPQRTNYAKELFRTNKLSVNFFYGIDGSLLNIDELNIYDNNKKWKIRNGVVGCCLSHFLLWKSILALDIDEAIIFEDDVELVDSFKEKLNEAYTHLPKNWDIFYLGGGYCNDSGNKIKISNVISSYYPTGLYGYMIKKKTLKLFLKKCYMDLIDIDVSLVLNVLSEINCYVADPILVTEKSVNNGKYPSSGIWKSLTYDWNK